MWLRYMRGCKQSMYIATNENVIPLKERPHKTTFRSQRAPGSHKVTFRSLVFPDDSPVIPDDSPVVPDDFPVVPDEPTGGLTVTMARSENVM